MFRAVVNDSNRTPTSEGSVQGPSVQFEPRNKIESKNNPSAKRVLHWVAAAVVSTRDFLAPQFTIRVCREYRVIQCPVRQAGGWSLDETCNPILDLDED